MSYGYFKATKKGISIEYAFKKFSYQYICDENIYYDYGNKDTNLALVKVKLKKYDSLYIMRLNDLGYHIYDVVKFLEHLYYNHISLYIDNREVCVGSTLCYIIDHMNYCINFDNYNLVTYTQY